ncbi:aminopeptidase [Campylobacter aviculae]|uniref:Aminopeptidase n=1 Tax=Campylobacter aviculae TaxID=2510190 RepID=A0A4U7BPN9_9BACT|nr:aminopeptidase [Campylobacter aviculae]
MKKPKRDIVDSLDFRSTDFENTGKAMYELAKELFPICRSITGQGFRDSLSILNNTLGGILQIHSIKSGTQVFDWIVPPEWHINDAFIITPNGEKICDFKKHNLHVLNYSEGIDREIELDELQNHLYSLEEKPDAIPYVTSYYKRRWGFCITHNERKKLKQGKYRVFIDAKHDENGVLNYADFIIPSTQDSKEEILISTYLCHPSMANNELSGPIVTIYLAKWLLNLTKRKYNYRFVIIPETIGSIVYIHKHLKHLQKYTKAGFVLSCLGDDNAYSLIHSPCQNTLSDKVALHTLRNKENFKEFNFLDRGSDERQYNAPLVNLGVIGACRSKYLEYKEYHTSKDDLNFISPRGLAGGLKAMQEIILNLEINEIYENTIFCEPNLGKRGLYHTLSTANDIPLACNFLAYCDGKNDIIDIAEILNMQAYEFKDLLEKILDFKLLKLSV